MDDCLSIILLDTWETVDPGDHIIWWCFRRFNYVL